MSIVVIIPVLNEARAIGRVIEDVPRDLVEEVIVVNNGSTDDTPRIAREAGAIVLEEEHRGYGWACLKGIEYARGLDPDVAVFLDGDYSDHPEEMSELVAPILEGEADFVVGSRILGESEPGAMLPQAEVGNRVACTLMRWIWDGSFTDLGPFRAIRFDRLLELEMEDKTYGWTVEMQIKALRRGLRCTEVPVSYRKRIGTSKVTGTLTGTLMASAKILWTIARYALAPTRGEKRSSRAVGVSVLMLSAALAAGVLAGCGPEAPEATGPPYEPEAALETFEVDEGLAVSLFAHEPHVRDPVAMEIDPRGRIFVVEMPGYPLDTGGSGRVKLLRDTDKDGRVDAHTVFADSLVLPTGVTSWRGGILVTDPPEVLYLADEDGDGRVDVRRTILTGFARSNPQHNTNSPIYGLDNGIYLANEGPVGTRTFEEQFGGRGDSVRFADGEGPVLPPNAGGRNVRFRPDTRELSTTSASTQFGHAFDTWGRHFLVDNTHHLYHEVLPAPYLERNPDLAVPTVVHHTPDHGSAAPVHPITENPQHQLLTDRGVITSASGVTAYLADALPERYRGAFFVAESVHNLVHADRLRPSGATFAAARIPEGREVFASRDPWSRPVNLYVGPEGALYVIDYYRRVIEHPEWMAREDTTGDLYEGTGRGRIYRITAAESSPAEGAMGGGSRSPAKGAGSRLAAADLESASDEQLIRRLGHPNQWWRRHAQRLLVDRYVAARAVAPERVRTLLFDTAVDHEDPAARVHALWTLEGIGALDPDVVAQALEDPHPGVRENALRLSERFLPESDRLAERVTAMAREAPPTRGGSTAAVRTGPGGGPATAPRAASESASENRVSGTASWDRVRYQLVLTLGELSSAAARTARRALLFEHADDPWMQRAALSARDARPAELLAEAIDRYGATPTREATLLREMARMTARAEPVGRIRSTLRSALGGGVAAPPPWAEPVLSGLADGLIGRDRGRDGGAESPGEDADGFSPSLIWGASERNLLASSVFLPDRPEVRETGLRLLARAGLPAEPERSLLLSRALKLATGTGEESALRADAIALLAEFEPAAHRTLFEQLVEGEEPLAVRVAAAEALGRIPGPESARYLIDRWNGLPAGLRQAVIDVLVETPERVDLLLDAVREDRLGRADLGWGRSVGLMMQETDSLRRRARELLGETAAGRQKRLARYEPALETEGDPSGGRAVFARVCSRCHRAGSAGGRSFGPDLATVRSRPPSTLLRDVLLPDQTIADGYQLWRVRRRHAPPLVGLITAETSTSLTLETAAGDSTTVRRDAILERSTSGMSAMPRDLHRQISVDEMADLLAFIRRGT